MDPKFSVEDRVLSLASLLEKLITNQGSIDTNKQKWSEKYLFDFL